MTIIQIENMARVLKSVSWGKPALSLLSQCKELDTSLPAAMHIRHSERPQIQSRVERGAILTITGKEAAFEFGVNLPKDRKYRLFHTQSERARETAEKIHEGLQTQGAKTHLDGVMSFSSHHNQEKFWDYLTRDVLDQGAKTAEPFFINWVSDHYPPWEVESGRTFAQRAAVMTLNNLQAVDSNALDIYVSHDLWIAAFLFYWAGIMPSSEWMKYLDGFILQLTDERIHVYSKEGKKEAYYPYWWNF